MAQAREYSAVTSLATANSVEEALLAIDSYEGPPDGFILRLAQSVIKPVEMGGQTVTGVQMALITDRVLSRGWCAERFEEDGEFRLYFYGAL